MPKLTLTAAGRAQQTLRSIRLELGLNLREASERIGCSISALSKVERSMRSFSFYYAVAVSKAYHIPLDSLALLLYPQSGNESWTPKRKWKSEPRQAAETKRRAPSAEGSTASASAPDGNSRLEEVFPAIKPWHERYSNSNNYTKLDCAYAASHAKSEEIKELRAALAALSPLKGTSHVPSEV